MSMGPSDKKQSSEITIADKANIAFKKIITAYISNPIGNLFYFSLAACMLGLLFNRVFPRPFYLILTILSIVELSKWSLSQNKKEETNIIINGEQIKK